MLRLSLVLVLSAVCLSQGYQGYKNVRTADMDFLHKQKKLFELMFYVDQQALTDAEYFEIGRNYDIGSNMEYYTDKTVVQDFLYRYKEKKFERGVLFSYYNIEMMEDMMSLYRLFYTAKDFQTFYKTACWARLYVNKYMFVNAYYTAVIYRSDCRYVRLPAPYEVFPYLYFDSRIIQEAQKVKMSRGNYKNYDIGMKRGSSDTYMIYSNYTGSCKECYYPEYRMSYFFDDIGLNSYYYYFRMVFPFWVNTKYYEVPKQFRGEFYYFFHKQLMARYYLERLSNDLGRMKPFDWYKGKFPGFYSNLMYPNGVAVPKRDEWYNVPPYKLDYLKQIDLKENRIYEAIDYGFVVDETGKQYNIYTPEGLNILGNMIEGNFDSFNYKYYGSYEYLIRNLFDYNTKYTCKRDYIPSSLMTFSTSMRDPMFYKLYDRILYFFQRYKENLKHYSYNELYYPGVKIESFHVDKLTTFFDYYDATINNAVAVENFKEGYAINMKARQLRLNYKPFTYRFGINSDKDTKVMVKIFLGPAYFSEKYDEYTYFRRNYMNFFELDRFEYHLKTGMNNVERKSTESTFTADDYTSFETYYRKIVKAAEGNEPFTYSEKLFGFPDRLLLPKGKREGMPYRLFCYVYPFEEGKEYEFPIFGKFYYDGKAFGYPLDRPVKPWFFSMPNAYFKDVMIYHSKEMSEYY
ncbi:arylphorin subunit alpha-like isoform X2 [Leptopilina boulardi]|uniref:arylphorin subunit alpha-like isoform X2 n=1 Tax=Leptopilina boulardi TaxID=63433 RepID=UPI0021F65A35|nr:arylphorin subunit alpha-like isoform X2 [Leptopilina boulardi]